MDNLYSRIEELCKAEGITCGKLATEIGIRRSVLGDLKTGRKQSLSTETMSKIAGYFGVTVDYLLGKTEKPAAQMDSELNEYLEELKNREEMRMLFSLAKGATKSDVEKAAKIIETLLGK